MSISDVGACVKPAELPAVLAALRALGGSALDLQGAPEPLSGGFWAEMYTLRLRDRGDALPERVVLRLAPDPVPAQSETAVQRAVADLGFPTPRILANAAAADGSRSWSVMEHADGTPLLAGLSGIGALARLPRLARDLPQQLASVSARLHALDASPIAAALERCTDPRTGVDGLLQHYAATARDAADAALARAVEALAADQPAPSRTVLCHGDLHPFNVLQHDDTLTVLDWTAARFADPAYDVAFTAFLLRHPPLVAPRALRPMIESAARALARRFTRGYDKVAHEPIHHEQFEWYTRLHHLRVLTDIARWRADDATDAHRGHPWFTVEASIRAALSA